MKKINFSFTLFFVITLFFSCNSEPELPVVLHEDMEKGAYPRLLNFNGSFDINNVENSSVSWEVEFYDEDQGTHVTEYEWMVSYIDNNNSTGDRPETLFQNFPMSTFTIHPESGLPSTSATWTLADVLSTLGLTLDDVTGGDEINFSATLKRDDGKEFTATNTGSNIISSAAFASLFSFKMPLLCSSRLEGPMTYSTLSWCGETHTGEIEWINEGNGVYNLMGGLGGEGHDFSFGAYAACYGGAADGFPNGGIGNLRFLDTCNKLSYQGASQWGDLFYIQNLIVDGSNLTIDWYNDYAPEAGVTTFTRTDGKDWPDLTY